MSTTQRLSWSQIRRLATCHRNWKLSYVDKITKVRDKVNYNLLLGKAFHRAMETHIMYRDYTAGLDMYLDSVECPPTMAIYIGSDIRNIMEYHIPTINNLLDTKYTLLDGLDATPLEYVIKTDKFIGIVDAIFKDKETGDIVVVDFKTRKRINNKTRITEGQLPLYVSVLDTLPEFSGVDVSMFEYWEFSITLPKPARILRSGKLSTANQDTTWDYWLETVPVGYELDEEYWRTTLKDKLKDESDYFSRSLHIMNEEEKAYMINLLDNSYILSDMVKNMDAPNATLVDWVCRLCEFNTLCSSDMLGTNYEHMIGTEYEYKSELANA